MLSYGEWRGASNQNPDKFVSPRCALHATTHADAAGFVPYSKGASSFILDSVISRVPLLRIMIRGFTVVADRGISLAKDRGARSDFGVGGQIVTTSFWTFGRKLSLRNGK